MFKSVQGAEFTTTTLGRQASNRLDRCGNRCLSACSLVQISPLPCSPSPPLRPHPYTPVLTLLLTARGTDVGEQGVDVTWSPKRSGAADPIDWPVACWLVVGAAPVFQSALAPSCKSCHQGLWRIVGLIGCTDRCVKASVPC